MEVCSACSGYWITCLVLTNCTKFMRGVVIILNGVAAVLSIAIDMQGGREEDVERVILSFPSLS